MTHATLTGALRKTPGAARPAAPAGLRTGLSAGTVVLTLDGALPVEFLAPGDRIVTRAGMRVLRRVTRHSYAGPAVRIRAGALGHDRPDRATILPETALVLLRDWRAAALFGAPQALVPVSALCDGEFVVPAAHARLQLFALGFDQTEILYADGLEIASAAADLAPESLQPADATRVAANPR